MDVGIGLPNSVRGADGRLLVAWARRAEERGFSSLGTIGRVAYPTFEEISALSAAAAVTSRIRLVTDILLAPTRSFVQLAKEAATLDQISEGRLTLGVGAGGRADDYAASGRDFHDRGRRLDEGLEVVHRAWRGEAVEGAGKPVSPRPAAGERVPVLAGGSPPVAAPRAVRWGVGWTAGGLPPDAVREGAAAVRATWRDADREGEPRTVALAYFGLGDEETSRRNLHDYYDFTEAADMITDAAARSPERVREVAGAYEDAGTDELILFPTVPRLDELDALADAVL